MIQLNKTAGMNPLLAWQSLWQAMGLLGHKDLRKYILIPIGVNLILYSALLYLLYNYVGDLIEQFIPEWLVWLSWLIYPISFVSFFVAGFFTFTLLANLIAAPFYGDLSAKTQQVLAHEVGDIEAHKILAVMASEWQRIMYLISRMLPLVIVTFIPGLNIIAPILWLLFGAWAISLEYLAYPLENEGLLFAEQRQAVSDVRIGALSLGGLVLFGLSVPVVNIIVPPLAVIAATIYCQAVKEVNVEF